MIERKRILGDWQKYFTSFCNNEDIDIKGTVMVAGINDGQEVGFLGSQCIIGIDISEEAVQRGKKIYPNINFVVDNLTKFLAEENSIDTYFSLRTLHFFKDAEIEVILSNAFRFLKGQGKIVVSIPGGFLTEEGEIIFGQKVDNDVIDEEKPMKDALKIEAFVKAANFVDTKIVNSKIELFIIGTKGEPL
jgi:SAM-dependent methyltransferase